MLKIIRGHFSRGQVQQSHRCQESRAEFVLPDDHDEVKEKIQKCKEKEIEEAWVFARLNEGMSNQLISKDLQLQRLPEKFLKFGTFQDPALKLIR